MGEDAMTPPEPRQMLSIIEAEDAGRVTTLQNFFAPQNILFLMQNNFLIEQDRGVSLGHDVTREGVLGFRILTQALGRSTREAMVPFTTQCAAISWVN